MLENYLLAFKHRRRDTEEIDINDSVKVAEQAFFYVESIAFIIGCLNLDDIEKVGGESFHCHIQNMTRILGGFSHIAFTELQRIEERRLQLEK